MNKDPYLQFRHAEGLGDIIACILHSKMFSFITYSILGSKDYCNACNQRRQALNVLFPIAFWKFFFKDNEEKQKDLEKYFLNSFEEKKETETTLETENFKQDKNKKDIDILDHSNDKNEIYNYILISQTESGFDDYIIKSFIYKKQ